MKFMTDGKTLYDIAKVMQNYTSEFLLATQDNKVRFEGGMIDSGYIATLWLEPKGLESDTETRQVSVHYLVQMAARLRKAEEVIISSTEDKLVLQGGGKRYNIPLFDDPSKSLFDRKQEDFTLKVKLKHKVWKGFVKDVLLKDHKGNIMFYSVQFSTESGRLVFSSKEDVGGSFIHKTKIETKTKATARYTTDLVDMMDGSAFCDTLEMEYADQYPLRITYPGEKVKAVFLLAPRIDND